MKEEIGKIIESCAGAAEIKVEDVSNAHSAHGHGFQGESHFEVTIKDKTLSQMQKIALHKEATRALFHLYNKNKVHSITINIL